MFKRGDLVVFDKSVLDKIGWRSPRGLKRSPGGGYEYINVDPDAVMIICNDSVEEREWWIEVFCNTSMSIVNVMEANLKLA